MPARVPAWCVWTLLVAAAGCAPAGRRNAVWLVISNRTEVTLHTVAVDYGDGVFRYQQVGPDYTYGGWAKIGATRPLAVSFVADGKPMRRDGRALTPDMIGGRVRLLVEPDFQLEQTFEPAARTPRAGSGYDALVFWGFFVVAAAAVAAFFRIASAKGSPS